MEILMSGLLAVVIAFSIFLSKKAKAGTLGQPLDWSKVLRTGIVGVVIGVAAQLKGFTLTDANYETYLAANGFLITMVDQGLKGLLGFIKRKTG